MTKCFRDIKFSLTNNKLVTIPKYVLNFFLWGPSAFLVAGSTWTTDLSAPGGLVAKDRSRVAFLVHFKTLYNYGARKTVLFGIGQIGCSPNELAQNSPDVSSEIDIAFAKDSIVLTLEPLADYPAPYEIPPTDSAEPPSLDNSPSDGSVEYIELYSTLLEYFDLTHYGAVADGRIDSSSLEASKHHVLCYGINITSNKHVVFVGDSMPRNQLESLLCMLSTGSTPNLVYRNDDDNITVLSIRHWFLHPAVYYEGGLVLGCHYCPSLNHTEIGFYDVLRKALRTTLNSIIDRKGGKGYGVDVIVTTIQIPKQEPNTIERPKRKTMHPKKNYKIKSAKESNLRNNELTSPLTHQLTNSRTHQLRNSRTHQLMKSGTHQLGAKTTSKTYKTTN
ncbi:Protein ALTERED XYLOGLUCAN 4 [Glycine soja]